MFTLCFTSPGGVDGAKDSLNLGVLRMTYGLLRIIVDFYAYKGMTRSLC